MKRPLFSFRSRDKPRNAISAAEVFRFRVCQLQRTKNGGLIFETTEGSNYYTGQITCIS